MPPNPPKQSGASDFAAEAIELAAAEWLVLQDRGLDTAQRRELDRWLAADTRHANAYSHLEETWHLLDRVPPHRAPMPQRHRLKSLWAAGALAAAAAVVIGLVGPGSTSSRIAGPVHSAATAIGGFESLRLPDGSVVRLNTATEIRMDFSAAERRITLRRGEASFEVAKDASRPFVVRAGEFDVRAVGTVFNVRQTDRAIVVLVVEGRVRLDDVASGRNVMAGEQSASEPAPDGGETVAPLLIAGQRATILRPSANLPVRASVADVAPAEATRALAWHSRQLEFSNEPLANIAAEFNRYNRHQLVIDDPELAAQRFGGKFPADDFALLVRLLEVNFAVAIERRQNETVLRRRAAAR